MSEKKETLVLGIGNYLMGDEGVGVHAIEALLKENFPENVHLIDGGTGGFHLLSFFHDYDPLILIDATMDEEPVGTVRLIEPRFASDFPRTLSAHDIGLRDLIETAILSAPLPKIYLIVISIREIRSMVMDLSPEIAQTIPAIVQMVKKIVEKK
ncbi:MAG: hydrogenase maturation protease [Bacteroidota bacterium]